MIRLTPRDEAIIEFLNEVKVADTQTLCNISFNGTLIFNTSIPDLYSSPINFDNIKLCFI